MIHLKMHEKINVCIVVDHWIYFVRKCNRTLYLLRDIQVDYWLSALNEATKLYVL